MRRRKVADRRQQRMDAEDGRILIVFDRHYAAGCDRAQFVELLVALDPAVAPAADDAVAVAFACARKMDATPVLVGAGLSPEEAIS